MLTVMRNVWALLFGMFLLMLGNGLQSTVLGVRGAIEDFGSLEMGFVMSAYFVGFLGGAQATPWLLRRVGHVRVFAALASLISAAMLLYAVIVHPFAWVVMRVIVGFCMSGAYVVAESWLNDGVENRQRGQALSAYLMVMMLGIVLAQALLNVADPAGYDLFVIMAVAVSLAIVPILLSVSPAPPFERTRRMTLVQLYKTSPLGCVGSFLLGGVFACLFGMSAVYGSRIGLTNAELSMFVGAIYIGGMVLQYPIGWVSDRIDRRQLIFVVCAIGGGAAALAYVASGTSFPLFLVAAFMIGGTANPLYSLMVAYTNDYLETDDMASAAAGLIVLNGVGAAGTPILLGYVMDVAGPQTFMTFVGVLMGMIAVFALYRMTVRPSTPVDETLPVAPMSMATSSYAGTVAQGVVIDQAEAAARADEAATAEEAAQTAGGETADGVTQNAAAEEDGALTGRAPATA